MIGFLHNPATDPCYNLALDEYLLTKTDKQYLTLWRNEPAVIIGRNQDALKEVDSAFLREKGIRLVRRMSGGGAVFHDLGNINFSYFVKWTESFDFAPFSGMVVEALRQMGVPAEISGRNDITVEGKKISGAAQHKHGDRLLHHGTLLFDADVSYMQQALRVDPKKLAGKGVSSVKSRVGNIRSYLGDMDITEFMEQLLKLLYDICPEDCEMTALSPSDIDGARKIKEEKYALEEWNYLHLGNYSFKTSERFASGGVDLTFNVVEGKLAEISFSGDFFGMRDISGLEDALKGTAHTHDSVEKTLRRIPLNEYISGVNAAEIAKMFF